MLIYLNLSLGPSTKKLEWDRGSCGLYYKLPQRLMKIRFRFAKVSFPRTETERDSRLYSVYCEAGSAEPSFLCETRLNES